MKKYQLFLFLGILLSVQAVRAQITLSLALNPRPDPYLSEWMYPVNGQMIISFFGGTVVKDPNVKLRTTLLDQSGSVIGISNINSARIYTLRQGVNQFTMADALQLQNLRLSGNVQNLFLRTGRLAAGQYQLIVELTNMTGDVVEAKQAKQFSVISYQLPILMQPANEAQLDAHISQNMIIFRWTSLVPNSSEQTFYRVQVFEILPGQTPMQAFRGNRPLLDEPASRGTTQYIWQPNLPMLDSIANHRFIWTIQTMDAKGIPVPVNDLNIQGRSDPFVFSIVNQTDAMEERSKRIENSTKH